MGLGRPDRNGGREWDPGDASFAFPQPEHSLPFGRAHANARVSGVGRRGSLLATAGSFELRHRKKVQAFLCLGVQTPS
jgi:hypothetical protein